MSGVVTAVPSNSAWVRQSPGAGIFLIARNGSPAIATIEISPLVAMVVEGPEAFKVVRTLMGATNPRDAAPGTLRGDLAIEMTENLVHGSDGPESAAREIALFFPVIS